MVEYSSAPSKKYHSKALRVGRQILAKYESLQAGCQLALFPIIIGCVSVVILLLYTLVITMAFHCLADYNRWNVHSFIALKVRAISSHWITKNLSSSNYFNFNHFFTFNSSPSSGNFTSLNPIVWQAVNIINKIIRI